MAKLANRILKQFFWSRQNGKSTEKRRTCILKLCIVCRKKTTPLQTRHGRQSSVKYGTRRHSGQVWCQWQSDAILLAHCSGHTALRIVREIQRFLEPTKPCDFKGRIIFMSILNDIERWIKDNWQTCLANATELTEYAKQFKLVIGVSVDLDTKIWYRSCTNKPNGACFWVCWERGGVLGILGRVMGEAQQFEHSRAHPELHFPESFE